VPTPSSADLDIINEVGFGSDTNRFHAARETEPPSIRQRTRYADAFDALDRGLEIDGTALDAPADEGREPGADSYDMEEPVPARAEPRIPVKLAAFLVVACVGLGAATATLVLHDRVLQITSSWTARR
jgi:hypothetical protein